MKTLGQVAYEAMDFASFGDERHDLWRLLNARERSCWERTAQALAAVVREECAKIAEKWTGGEYPGGEHLDPAVMIAAKIRNSLDPKPESG